MAGIRLTNFQNGLLEALVHRSHAFGKRIYRPEIIYSLYQLENSDTLWKIVKTWKIYQISSDMTKYDFINAVLLKEICRIDTSMKDIDNIEDYYSLNDRIFFSSLGYTYSENINFNLIKF